MTEESARKVMTDNNKLGLIVAYYLSRFSEAGQMALGYETFSEACTEIGKILGVKRRTIQNYRDQFDPYHDNNRVGWYQRPITPSRKKVIQAFQELDEHSVRSIVLEILNRREFRSSVQCKELLSIFTEKEYSSSKKTIFIPRGETGIRAEKFFKEYFKTHRGPYNGELIDRRHQGVGYDFEIKGQTKSYYIEVKGLAEGAGGILFTDKEWKVANDKKEEYILALVRMVKTSPEIFFIANPSNIFTPAKNIYPVVTINWPVSDKDIKRALEEVSPEKGL